MQAYCLCGTGYSEGPPPPHIFALKIWIGPK